MTHSFGRSFRWLVFAGMGMSGMAMTARVHAADPGAGAAPAAASGPFQPPALYAEPLPTVHAAGRLTYPMHVVGLRDLTYKEVAGYRPLKLDLYVPENTTVRHPAVVWIHGGGWEIGNPRADWTYGDWTQVLARLAARGYVVAAITYRFNREAAFPAAIQDVKDAIRFVRKHADLYGVDSGHIAAWGLSAGGHLAALAGTTCHVDALNAGSSDPALSPCVQAVVDWFGPADFNLGASSSNVAKLLGCAAEACTHDELARGSPVTYVSEGAPPFLLMQGGEDPLVPPEQSARLEAVLKAHGDSVQRIVYPGLGHGFSGATPQQEQQFLDEVFRFFDRTLHAAASRG